MKHFPRAGGLVEVEEVDLGLDEGGIDLLGEREAHAVEGLEEALGILGAAELAFAGGGEDGRGGEAGVALAGGEDALEGGASGAGIFFGQLAARGSKEFVRRGEVGVGRQRGHRVSLFLDGGLKFAHLAARVGVLQEGRGQEHRRLFEPITLQGGAGKGELRGAGDLGLIGAVGEGAVEDERVVGAAVALEGAGQLQLHADMPSGGLADTAEEGLTISMGRGAVFTLVGQQPSAAAERFRSADWRQTTGGFGVKT